MLHYLFALFYYKIMKELKMTAPDGKVFNEEKLKEGIIEFIDEETIDSLPESWEELGTISGEYIREDSVIGITSSLSTCDENRNIAPEGLGEPLLALIQLLQLRVRYNNFGGEWEADWADYHQPKYIIYADGNRFATEMNTNRSRILAFKSRELRNKFLDAPEIMKLMEIAKPLL